MAQLSQFWWKNWSVTHFLFSWYPNSRILPAVAKSRAFNGSCKQMGWRSWGISLKLFNRWNLAFPGWPWRQSRSQWCLPKVLGAVHGKAGWAGAELTAAGVLSLMPTLLCLLTFWWATEWWHLLISWVFFQVRALAEKHLRKLDLKVLPHSSGNFVKAVMGNH